MAEERNTGASTNQMLRAPKGSVYIIKHHASKPYFIELANHLKRIDLDIQSVSVLDDYSLCGQNRPIVLDHSVILTADQLRKYTWLTESERAKKEA